MTKIKTRNQLNQVARLSSLAFSFLIGALLVTLITFILVFAIDGFKNYGFWNILFQGSFNRNEELYSFWVPFSATLLTSLIALLVSVPLGIKVAIFTKYRLKKSKRKYVLVLFQTLSGIPSVIFGFFAAQSLGIIWQKLFNIAPYSIFNGAIMLSFMVLPTIITLTLDSLNSIDENFLANAQALGNSKSRAIYKICKKGARSGILVAIIIALSRAIGESMAVSMILQAQPNDSFLSSGAFGILNSSSQTLGAFISTAMFADSDPEKIRPLLYAFGLILLFLSMILNTFILIFSKKKYSKKNSLLKKIETWIDSYILWVPVQFKILWEKLTFKSKHKISKDHMENIVDYMNDRNRNYKFSWFYSAWKISWEIISLLVCFSFVAWIIGDIVVNGLASVSANPNNFFVYSKNSVSQSFVNTLIIIFCCLLIGFPIALMCAIYLNEYAREGKLKRIIIFFLDSLGSLPSIIFGLFGMLFFIQTFGWTANGRLGNSLIAGALTLILVVIPSFVRLLEQALKNVPNEIRTNAYALGSTKWETISKLVLPIAMTAIVTSIISTVGRIFSETAPLYLTAGLSSSKVSVLDQAGTTLTTHIYAQIFSPSASAVQEQYQAAFLTLIMVLSLVVIGYLLIPNFKIIKKEITERFHLLRDSLKSNKTKNTIE